MGQSDVIEVLKKNKGWMIVGEMMSELEQSRVVIKSELMYLFKKGLVERKEVKAIKNRSYLWKFKG